MSHFTGIHYIDIKNDEVVNVLKNRNFADYIENFNENDYILAQNENKKVIGKYKIKNNNLIDLPFVSLGKGKNLFTPLNPEQECAFDLLADNDIKIKLLTGVAGTGKTKIAIQFGLHKLLKGEVKKIFLVRNPVHIGEELGFHKGDKKNKSLNWNNPIKDNMGDRLESLEEMADRGMVELDIPSEMKGRNIEDSWIIVDEAEDLTEEVFKMLGERVSSGSTIIFTGDIKQVSKVKFKNSSGLERAFGLKGKTDIFGSVELIEVVRSEVSKVFATLY